MSGSAPIPNYGGSAPVSNFGGSAPVPNYGGPPPATNEEEQHEEEEEEEVEEEEEAPRSKSNKVMAFSERGYPLYTDNHKRLSNWLGDLARDWIPITVHYWLNFSKEHPKLADDLWQHTKVIFFKTN